MTFTAPLGLLALLALPVIVALHLFRHRLPERSVAALFLFPVTSVSVDGGRTRSQLVRSPSLWLECLAAVLLTLWLAGFAVGARQQRHVVVVLDDSASMAADGVRERVLVVLQELATELRPNDDVTMLVSGPVPEVVLGPLAPAAELLATLAVWRPAKPQHALLSALDLGRELVGQGGEVVCLTDTEPGAGSEDLRVVACGRARGNAMLGAVRRQHRAGSDRLLIDVTAFGEVLGGDVIVRIGEREPMRVPVVLPVDGEVQLALPIPVAADRIAIELPPDALATDNVAWSMREPLRVVAVCDQLAPAMRDGLQLDRVFSAMRDWRPEPDPARAQVLLRDRAGRLRPGQLELILAATAGAPRGHRSPFVVDRSHALLAGVALDGVAWQAGGGELPGQVLVADGEKVLISEQWSAAGRSVFVDVDASAGNLVRSPDWPILFANVLDAGRREVPGPVTSELRVGEQLTYRSENDEQLVAVDPAGRVLATAGDGHLECVVRTPGVHRVRTMTGTELAQIAVRFVDAHESDLSRAVSFDRQPTVGPQSASRESLDAGPMRQLLMVLLLATVLADWWWLARQGA